MANYDSGPIRNHAVVSHEEWLKARVALLEKEKELSRARDELARQRRALPWERVDKQYWFDAADGKQTTAGLELQMGLVRRGGLQLRLRRLVPAG